MAGNKFEGETLPFTRGGWTRQIASGSFRNGATWKHIEKVKVLGRGTMGAKLEEVHILASWDIDQGGNKTINKRRGQHFLSLKKGARELAFAIHDKTGWRVLTYDCSCYLAVETQQEAEKILSAAKWQKWKKKRGGTK
jgi:3-hydroxyacyl-CoA dehydrogenase